MWAARDLWFYWNSDRPLSSSRRQPRVAPETHLTIGVLNTKLLEGLQGQRGKVGPYPKMSRTSWGNSLHQARTAEGHTEIGGVQSLESQPPQDIGDINCEAVGATTLEA